MSGVFISYRREDSSGYAGRLFDVLSVHFGKENTYMDLDTIRGGDDFVTVIDEKIRLCDVLLAVIGDRWLTCTGENGRRRLDMAGDFVRLEIAKALERQVRVIPVLVGGATMPHREDLPDDLGPLSLHQAMDLRDAHFHADAELLVDEIGRIVPSVVNRPRNVRSNRFLPAVASVLLLAAVVAGILLFRQGKPPAHETPDPAAQKQIASANGTVPSTQANELKTDGSKEPAKKVAGKWQATVKYDWGAVFSEKFEFEVDGSELSGNASFLELDRGIFDGTVGGDRLSFMTKSQTALGDQTYEEKHYYKGRIVGDTIQFSMLTDSPNDSHAAVRFTARRIGAK